MAAINAIAAEGAEAVRELAETLRDGCPSWVETAERVVSWVQLLPQVPDPPGSADWVKLPCATASLGGDCDDLSALAIAMFLALGVKAQAAWVPVPDQAQDHMSVKVRLMGRWLWAEPMVRGARIGESPEEAVRRLGGGSRVLVA